jgi:hypothetical protein
MGTRLLRSAQSQFAVYGIDSKADPDPLLPVRQSQMTFGADWSGAGGGRDAVHQLEPCLGRTFGYIGRSVNGG